MMLKTRYWVAVLLPLMMVAVWLFSTPIARADRAPHHAMDPAVAETRGCGQATSSNTSNRSNLEKTV